ncbi:MAG: sugar phosphate isomerase/epimerase [Ruminococcaceae bacterium]|nr:sugar phosphate isomerase/epimerase [Oscillospiraceae bacterium]
MIIGAQLYGLREYTKTLEDFKETLKKVADMGYTSVQVSGTCPYEGEWLANALKETGLTCDLTHYSFDEMKADAKAVVEKHKKFGCKYIGIGCMPKAGERQDKSVWKEFTDAALPVAKTMQENGAYLMYHNHAFEFENIDGEYIWDHITGAIPADIMGLTVDTHWVATGKRDVIEILNSVKDRIPCVHFKDTVIVGEERRFAPVGHGILDFESIIKTCLDLDVKYAFVEQDNCYGEDPFLCMKKSYDYLKSMGLK